MRIFWFFGLLLLALPAAAQTRAALVIGNCLYEPSKSLDAAENLPNACKDARAMAQALRDKNFEVLHEENLNTEQMEAALVAFKKRLNPGAAGVFYYAGHALQDNGLNYLLPVRTRINCDLLASQLPVLARVTAQGVLQEMKVERAAMKILMLDACRISPLQNCSRAPRGLARMNENISRGTVISFATGPNEVAYDASGYTPALVQAMDRYGHLPVTQMLRRAGEFMNPEFKQTPWVESIQAAVGADFCFGECGGGIVPPSRVNLTVRSNVPEGGDTVWIDGEVRGPTKLVAALEPGLHHVEVRAEGYRTWSREVELSAPYTVWARLEREQRDESIVWLSDTVFQDRLADGSLGPKMALLPGGSFRMGDIRGQGQDDEQPVHSVRVEKFAVGVYEVTVGEFRRFARATGHRSQGDDCYVYQEGSWKQVADADWDKPYFPQNDQQPVVCVSWHDAAAYAEWLSGQTGQNYRLPTEAEWEYAARAGTDTARYWGDTADEACGYANVGDQSLKRELNVSWTIHACADGYVYTAPVGAFRANRFGLYDMLGNVWEWTCSEYANYKEGKESACLGKNHADARVIRGGSWNYGPAWVRSADRDDWRPASRINSAGFRLARMF